MKKISLIASLAATIGGLIGIDLAKGKDQTAITTIRRNQPRPCLNTGCKKMHKHNNAYCSATCCNEHKQEKRSTEHVKKLKARQ